MVTEPEIQEQVLRKTAEYLKGLALGVPAAEIVVRRHPWEAVEGGVNIHRGITVSPVPERFAPGTNRGEDIGYGVMVTDITPRQASSTEGIPGPTARKTTIRRAFVHQRPLTLEIVNGHYLTTTVEPGEMLDQVRGIDKYDVSSFVLRFWIREERP